MMYEIPLTPEQKIFAAQNHDLVYKFLQEKDLSIDEYYDIIVFGYLRSVKRFFSEPQLHQYTFGTIAWKAMHYSLNNYKKGNCRQKRDAKVYSISSEFDEDNSVPEGILTTHNDLMIQLEINLLLHDLARRVSKQQMEIVRMRASGYNLQDIATRQNTSAKRIKMLLGDVHRALTELCRE